MIKALPALAVCSVMIAPAFSAANDQHSFDFSPWKITIPDSQVDYYGKGKASTAAELLPVQCRDSREVLGHSSRISGSNDVVYFEVTEGRAHFRADMGRGVTTENSNYIRSELRELFNVKSQDKNPCSTSTDKTSWFINDVSTGTKKHTLSSTLRIDEYPDREVTNEMPKVVVGQVHGWQVKQALVKVQWEGNDKPVRVILNQDFFLDNKSCSSDLAPSTGCEQWPFSVEMGLYEAGSDWTYDITVDDKGIYLMTNDAEGGNKVERVLPWGETFEDRDGRNVTLSNQWVEGSIAYYFKAGIYPQFRPNKKFEGQLFDVSFSKIELTHK
ncbi:polysaccharide lyase family 7 protein [Vibrio agarivorans]|uniref:polysaccharide lyase family 7 protein n=1 Tax=Vibrio agarivorans TaxID=153622 RepID=UPI002230F298|nr:polysaccharide lyase family 7 protein [Vibrio agarivorans]MDN3663458.1 polysaccharide lyase family 7 protein [Vibrio agarivorans]